MSYEEFKTKITEALSDGFPATWTEVRTRAGLPQKFPNNQWVKRLEADASLIRDKDKSGIMHWRIDR